MNRSLAARLSSLLGSYSGADPLTFSVRRERERRALTDFHKWADRKPLLSADHVEREDGMQLYLLLIRWNESPDWYLVLFPDPPTNPYAELHRTANDGHDLTWRYAPRKRDGRNEERSAYFESKFGSTNVHLSVPESSSEVKRFLNDAFALVEKRLQADRLDAAAPDQRDEFSEGAYVEGLHTSRERNRRLIELAKKLHLKKHGHLSCAVCGFDFEAFYGPLGRDFIEAHHVVPLSELTGATVTKVDDLALVCANCHRMLHRRRPWTTMASLKKLAVRPSR